MLDSKVKNELAILKQNTPHGSNKFERRGVVAPAGIGHKYLSANKFRDPASPAKQGPAFDSLLVE